MKNKTHDDINSPDSGHIYVNHQSIIPDKPKVNYMILGIVVSVCFLIIGFGGYYLGLHSSYSKSIVTNRPNQIYPTSPLNQNGSNTMVSPNTDLNNNWKTYSNSSLGIQFEYPGFITLSESDTTSTTVASGVRTGDIFNIYLTDALTHPDITMGGISKNFSEGRGGAFYDTQGYIERDGNFYCIKQDHEYLIRKNLVTKISNPNGVEMLIINSGLSEPNPAGEENCTEPDFGNIGVLINLHNNQNYTGMGILYTKSNQILNNDAFNKILSSFKYTNS